MRPILARYGHVIASIVFVAFCFSQCSSYQCDIYTEADSYPVTCNTVTNSHLVLRWLAAESRPDFWTAVFTGILTVATIFLWLATRRLFQGAEKTSIAQLRAYVNVGKKKLEGVVLGGNPRFVLTAKNYGKTPAINLRTLHTMRIVDSNDLGGFCIEAMTPNRKEGSVAVVGPNTAQKSECFLRESRNKKYLDPDIWTQISSTGTKRISIDGLIEYDDVFGQRHWTRFRFLSSTVGEKAGLRWAPNGSQIGTYEKHQKSELDDWLRIAEERIGSGVQAGIGDDPTICAV